MKKNEKTTPNYHVHSFMLELGLTTSELMVYAFIYSFSKGEPGVYYGTQRYLATTIGISERTVLRVYKKLYQLKLIEKYESEDGKIKGIRALVPQKKEETLLPEIIKTPKSSYEIEETLTYIDEKYIDAQAISVFVSSELNKEILAKRRKNFIFLCKPRPH